jgi:hypothetical protein
MAKKAKKKQNNNPTPAEATVSLFEETECRLNTPAAYPSRKIPSTKERNSAFIDLDKQNASHAEVFQALKELKTISGVKYRRDLRVVEVVFKSEEQRNNQVSNDLKIPNNKTVFMNLPRHLVPKVIYIRLANLPLEGRDEILSAVKTHWSSFGEVLDAAPHTIKGTDWLTHRWDLLIQMPNDDDKLEAPVSFELLGRKIVAAWAGCPPSCLVCLDAGHQAKKCPLKKSNSGERSDPVKKSARRNPYAENLKKGSEATPVTQSSASGSSTKPKQASTSDMHASAHVKATGSTPASSSVVTAAPTSSEAMDTETTSTAATAQLNPAAAAFNPTARPQTPPEQMLSQAIDPDTPRSHAGKRQAKEDLQPEMNSDFDVDVQTIIRHAGLCFRCGCILPCIYCPKHSHVGKKHIKKRSQDILRVYGKSFPAKKSTSAASLSTGDMQAVEQNIRLDPFVDVPPFCSKCKTAGHLAAVCPRANCNHCQSEEHIGVYCPQRPQYAFGLEPIDADYSKPWH